MNSTVDDQKIIGDVELILYSDSGNVKQKIDIKNLVVSAGKDWIASRMVNASGAVMSHMAIGTGTASTMLGQTTLATELVRSALGSTTRTGNQITYSTTYAAGVGTGTITEAGIFNATSLGTMLCRTVFLPVNKDAADSLTVNWTITIV